jgi:hypothetical protein
VKAEEERQHAAKVARKRIALVISNSNTQKEISHANAVEVGARVEEALNKKLSFDVVELVCNAPKEDMDAAISRFVAQAGENQPCDTLFFFGSGAEKDGSSYLFGCDKKEEAAGVNLGEDVVKRLNGPFVRVPGLAMYLSFGAQRTSGAFFLVPLFGAFRKQAMLKNVL